MMEGHEAQSVGLTSIVLFPKEVQVDEVIRQVADRAGIDEEQARTAIEAVIEQLEARLPGPIASELRGALAGNTDIAGEAERLKGMGGMLGR